MRGPSWGTVKERFYPSEERREQSAMWGWGKSVMAYPGPSGPPSLIIDAPRASRSL